MPQAPSTPPTYGTPQVPQAPVYDTYAPGPTLSPQVGAPNHNGHNPYEFIFNGSQQPKQGLLGGSLLKRSLVIVGGLVVLAIIAAIAISLLTPKDNSFAQLTSVLQEQQEIVRVADITDKSASTTDLKNLAVNVSLGVGTNKVSLQKYLTTRKVKINDTILAAKKDSKTDTLFANAKAASAFDKTAAQTIQSLLVTYRANLNSTYQTVKGTKARAELQTSYQTADLLITEANKVVGQ